jgi:hypothetical protein
MVDRAVPVRIVGNSCSAHVPTTASPQPKSIIIRKKKKAAADTNSAAVPREHCLECGVDLSGRKRLQTCPDCGSLLCSAKCYREHRYQSHR